MKKLLLTSAFIGILALTACNTVDGFGRDVRYGARKVSAATVDSTDTSTTYVEESTPTTKTTSTTQTNLDTGRTKSATTTTDSVTGTTTTTTRDSATGTTTVTTP